MYVSTVTTAFSALMRLSLRLMAERGGRGDALGRYLDEPLRLFIPARLLLAVITVVAASLLARVTGVDAARGLPLLIVATRLVRADLRAHRAAHHRAPRSGARARAAAAVVRRRSPAC